MITNVSLVSVWVTDLDESLAFYTDVLGFEKGDDVQLGPRLPLADRRPPAAA